MSELKDVTCRLSESAALIMEDGKPRANLLDVVMLFPTMPGDSAPYLRRGLRYTPQFLLSCACSSRACLTRLQMIEYIEGYDWTSLYLLTP